MAVTGQDVPAGMQQVSAAETVFGMLEAEEPTAPDTEQQTEAAKASETRQEPKPDAPDANDEARELEADAKPESEAAADGGEAEGEVPDTLVGLAEAIDVEPGYLYGLKVEVPQPDGSSKSMTLGELKDGAQDLARAGRARTEIEQQRAAMAQERQRQTSEIDARLQVVNALLQRVQASYVPNELRQSDPAEWSARMREIESVAQEAQSLTHQGAAVEQQRLQQQLQQQAQVERAKLLEHWPEWAEPARAQAHYGQLVDGATKEYGFTPEECHSTIDSRVLRMLNDALAYRRGESRAAKAKVTAAKKRVAKLPKIMRSGPRETEAERQAESRANRMDMLRQVGRQTQDSRAGMGLATSLVEDMLGDM